MSPIVIFNKFNSNESNWSK